MRRIRSACAGTVAAFACALGAAPALAETVTIDAVDVPAPAFQPASVTIDRGDTVRWGFGLALTAHTVTSSSPNWSLNEIREPEGESIERTFDTPGTYSFVCIIHPMSGSVVVRPDADPGPGPGPDPGPGPGPDPIPGTGPLVDPGTPRVAPAIVVPRGARTVNSSRLANVATLRCPPGGGPCAVAAPKRVGVQIAGKRHTLSVLAPGKVRAGGSAAVRVRLPGAAASQLNGRRASVTLRLALGRGETEASRRFTVVIARPRRG